MKFCIPTFELFHYIDISNRTFKLLIVYNFNFIITYGDVFVSNWERLFISNISNKNGKGFDITHNAEYNDRFPKNKIELL